MQSGKMNYPVTILSHVIKVRESAANLQVNGSYPSSKADKGKKTGITPLPRIDKRLAGEKASLINHPDFTCYCLNTCDILCMASLWKKHLENINGGLGWNALCSEIGMDPLETTSCLIYIESLLDRRIISFDENVKSDYHVNPIVILTGEFVLNGELILKILGRSIPLEIEKMLAPIWRSNSDFIFDLKLCLNTIFNCFGEADSSYRRKGKTMQAGIFFKCINPLLNKLKDASETLTVHRMIVDNHLDELEICIFMLVLYTQLTQDDCISDLELLSIISGSSAESKEYARYISPGSRLISNGIIEANEIRTFVNRRELSVPESLKRHLCNELPEDKNNQISAVIERNSAFRLVEVSQSIDDLIIPGKDKELLISVSRFFLDNKNHDLAEWGFDTGERRSNNRAGGLVILFYGEPGTGKTYAAGALANAMGKSLVAIDCSVLRDRYYSESEKLVRKVFDDMKWLSDTLSNPPVFLMNEVDQLVHNRIMHDGDCSRTENSLQNIILEALEGFPGILILTTNLERSIDEAYFRRFSLKLRFSLPDYECRYKLWKLHLNKKIPGADCIDTEYLAKTYMFSGGQIDLIIKNACKEAVLRSGNSRQLYMNDIIKYAELEQPWIGIKQGKSVGF